MTKIVQFFSIQNSLPFFTKEEIIQQVSNYYSKTELGKIDLSIPWNKIMRLIKPCSFTKGPQANLSPKSQIAIMILKSYTKLSDLKLCERINSDIHFRIFCRLDPNGPLPIKNFKYISRVRVKLGKIIDWDKYQQLLYNHWAPYIKNKGDVIMDATCYETDMRYPTDAKILWESLEYIIKHIKRICKSTKTKYPRSKYNEIKQEYIKFSRRRKKSYKATRKMIKKLLYLSKKILSELERLQEENGIVKRSKQFHIEKVLDQQTKKQKGEKISSPLLSLSKPYIRPIVRGKETKRVEFGAKVNKIQIDSINFVEHISFNAFHEGIRYEESVRKSEQLTGTKVRITGADAIYATNSNRRYAKNRSIFTDFTRKGRAGKNEKSRKKASSQIRKVRGSRLEGSFGVEKRAYGLDRIKARTENTEILMIYMGIHTKNMLEIGRRILKTVVSDSEEHPLSSKVSA